MSPNNTQAPKSRKAIAVSAAKKPNMRQIAAQMGQGGPMRYIMPDPFPQRRSIILNYASYDSPNINVSGGVWGTVAALYNLNSLFSPKTAGAHQPYGWDTLTSLYNRYRVDRVKIRVVAQPCQVSSAGPTMLAMVVNSPESTLSVTGTTFDRAMEHPNVSWRMLSASSPTVIEFDISIAALCGLTPGEHRDNDAYSASVGTNPTKIPYFCVNAGCFTASGTSPGVAIEITYFGEMWDRVSLAQS